MSKTLIGTLIALLALCVIFAIIIPLGAYSPYWIYVPGVPTGLLVYYLYMKSKFLERQGKREGKKGESGNEGDKRSS